MKIYNKKGLLWGIVWTAAGAFCLYRDVADASSFLPQQIKSVVLSLIMLAVGVTGFVRAFSKKASREDKVEEQDERSRLVRLKTSARTLSILMWVQLGTMVLGLLSYVFTENLEIIHIGHGGLPSLRCVQRCCKAIIPEGAGDCNR